MEPHRSKPISISCFLFFLVLLAYSRSLTAQEVEDEREFDYLQEGGKGPKHWGEIKEEWAACNSGSMQSPIDLSNHRVTLFPNLGKLKTNFKPRNATIKNRGHDISVEWVDDAGTIKINGTEYPLKQCHWHAPAEHSINGRVYDMELHLVHLSPDPNVANKIAVTAVLYKFGRADSFLSTLMKDVESMIDQMEERSMGIIDPREIKIRGKSYYRYMGSLTVPPCTEGVIWTINKRYIQSQGIK